MQNSSMLIAGLVGAAIAIVLLLVIGKLLGIRFSRSPRARKAARDFEYTQVEEPATQQFEDPRDDPPTQQLR